MSMGQGDAHDVVHNLRHSECLNADPNVSNRPRLQFPPRGECRVCHGIQSPPRMMEANTQAIAQTMHAKADHGFPKSPSRPAESTKAMNSANAANAKRPISSRSVMAGPLLWRVQSSFLGHSARSTVRPVCRIGLRRGIGQLGGRQLPHPCAPASFPSSTRAQIRQPYLGGSP